VEAKKEEPKKEESKAGDDLFAKFGHLKDADVYQIGTQGQMIYKDVIEKTSSVSNYDKILDNAIKSK